MKYHTVRRGLRMVNLLLKYGNVKLTDLMLDIVSEEGRTRLFNIYDEMGIREAEKHFKIDAKSEKYPLRETFIFKMYDYCDYRNKTLIDIGAQTGDSVLYFALRGAKKIYAFEPLTDNYEVLLSNVQANNVDCDCYNVGLSDSETDLVVDIDGKMAKPISKDDTSVETKIIRMKRLDDYKLSPDVIKVDVEGFEMDVLKGGLNTLSKTKRVIIETHNKFLRHQVAKLLRGLGFHMRKKINNWLVRDVRLEYWERPL
jgi:FkbM family methyltransferase